MTFGSGQYPQPSGASGAYGSPHYPAVHQPHFSVAAPQAPVPALPSVSTKGRRPSVWIFVVLGVLLPLVVAYFTWTIGPEASTIAFIVSLLPLTVVILAALVIDRWEPEPVSMVIFALLWGGIAAVVITLLVGYLISAIFPATPTREFLSIVVQAPIVEEIAKGIGLILIYLMAKRTFDGPMDGVVYAMLIGAGFAFTENIQYFALNMMQYGFDGLAQTFQSRAVMGPFAHAMYTAVTGFAFGVAVRRGRRGNKTGMFLLGLLGAIVLHAFWNGSAMLGVFDLLYWAIQVPLFIGFIVGVILLRRDESRRTRDRLGEYVQAGWFTPQEVTMLGTSAGRRAALAWATTRPGNRRHIMKDFIRDAAALASTRQRAVGGHDDQVRVDEWTLLTRTAAQRQALLAP